MPIIAPVIWLYVCVWLVVQSSLAKRGRTNLVVQTSIGPIARDFEIHMFSIIYQLTLNVLLKFLMRINCNCL